MLCNEIDRDDLLGAYLNIPPQVIDITIIKNMLRNSLVTGKSLTQLTNTSITTQLDATALDEIRVELVERELAKIKERLGNKKRPTEESKKTIKEYYKGLTSESNKKAVTKTTLAVFDVATSCYEEDREILFNAYLGIPQELMEVELLKAIFEAGLVADSSEVTTRLSGFPIRNDKFDTLMNNLAAAAFPSTTVELPKSALTASKHLVELMQPEYIEEYKERIKKILEEFRTGRPKIRKKTCN